MDQLVHYLARFGVRAAGAHDAAFLARLYACTRTDLLGDGSADPAFAAALVAMHQRMQAADYRSRFPHAVYLIVQAQGAPVGRLVLERTGARLHLVDIALLPEARGAGTGSAVLRALQHWAAQHNSELSLTVQPANSRARRLYAALGFLPNDQNALSGSMRWRADFV